MGGRGGSPNRGPTTATAPAAAPVAAQAKRLKPRELRKGMWILAPRKDGSGGNVWHQVGSVRNEGRSGRNTFGQFVIYDTAGDRVARLSPNGTALVDMGRSS